MKTIPTLRVTLLIATAGLAGWWTWQTVRHARLNLVTLHVRDTPLPEVLRRIERQTGERLLVDQRLASNALVSLDAKAAPLADALADLAQQSGGFWRATYAVHDTAAAAERLAATLRSGGDPGRTGWTNLTPRGPIPEPDGGLPHSDGDEGGPEAAPGALEPGQKVVLPFPGPAQSPGPRYRPPGPPGGPRVRVVHRDTNEDPPDPDGAPPEGVATFDMDVVAPGPAGGSPIRRVLVRGGRTGPDGHRIVEDFDLSPERLLLEERLLPRLPTADPRTPLEPSEAGARQLAEKVRGRWTLLYCLEPSPVPGLPAEIQRLLRSGPPPQRIPVGGPPSIDEAENRMRRARLDDIERSTPEQRARQAAERRRTGARAFDENSRN